MKYVKMLGLLAVAAAALMAFAGSASASSLTSPTGTTLGKGTIIRASSTNSSLTGTINISCKKSEVEGEVTNAGGAGVTVEGTVTKLTFEECDPHTVTVIKKGTLSLHVNETNMGTLTSSGAEVTVLTHSVFLGTIHCIYKTNNTPIGTVTGGEPATLHATSQSLERISTDFGCGEHSTWNGDYTINSPNPLHLDV